MIDYLVTNITKVVDRSQVINSLPNIFASFAYILLGALVYKLTSRLLKKILLKGRVNEAFSNLLIDNLYKVIIVMSVFVAILSQFGINIKTAITGVGVIGIAIGFAAQDSLSNIIAGFLIFFDKPFLVGDYITIGDNYGRVELITMRSTRIRTQDNKYIVIPNQKIINEVLVDHSTNGDTRIIIKVSIAYRESVSEARRILLDAVADIEGILKKPEPDVVVSLLGDSGVQLLVRVWIKNARREQEIFFKTSEVIKTALESAGIEIPFPHVHIVGDK